MSELTCKSCQQTFFGAPRNGGTCPLCNGRLDGIPRQLAPEDDPLQAKNGTISNIADSWQATGVALTPRQRQRAARTVLVWRQLIGLWLIIGPLLLLPDYDNLVRWKGGQLIPFIHMVLWVCLLWIRKQLVLDPATAGKCLLSWVIVAAGSSIATAINAGAARLGDLPEMVIVPAFVIVGVVPLFTNRGIEFSKYWQTLAAEDQDRPASVLLRELSRRRS